MDEPRQWPRQSSRGHRAVIDLTDNEVSDRQLLHLVRLVCPGLLAGEFRGEKECVGSIAFALKERHALN